MDKKELRKVTKQIYEEYGFVQKGRYFYLDLEDVLICSGFSYARGVTYLSYNFSIKAIHSIEEFEKNNMFDGFDSYEIKIVLNPTAEGYHQHEICCDAYSANEYALKLTAVLKRTFDPYKENALDHIKRGRQEIGVIKMNDIILLKVRAKEYLELE